MPYGIEGLTIDGNDVVEVFNVSVPFPGCTALKEKACTYRGKDIQVEGAF